MNITFNFKNFEPSDHLRDYARKRFDKLAKYTVATDASELQVNLAVEKTRQMADVIFPAAALADILIAEAVRDLDIAPGEAHPLHRLV